MEIFKKDNFRIHTITVLGEDDKSIKDGLAVEKQCGKLFSLEPSYYVICYIKYNKKEECAEIESICTRLLDIQDDEFSLFKDMVNVATLMINIANSEYNEGDTL